MLRETKRSLTLRLRDADVAAEVICQYVNVEQAALDGLYRIAVAELLAAQKAPDARPPPVPLTQPTFPRSGRGSSIGTAHRFHRARRGTRAAWAASERELR